jgi:hypothetical protein
VQFVPANNDMNTRTVQIVDDPDHPGELLLDLGNELCAELGWAIGDTVQWIDLKDGSWQITKILPTPTP